MARICMSRLIRIMVIVGGSRTFRHAVLRIITFEQEKCVIFHAGLVVPFHCRSLYHESCISLLRSADAVRLNEILLGEAIGVADSEGPVLQRAIDRAP